MSDPSRPVTGYIKGNRYQVTFEKTDDGGATISLLDVAGDVYTPTDKGFRGKMGHETDRGLSVIKTQPDGRFAVTLPDADEPITATAAGMDFGAACEFAAKHAAACVLRDKAMRDR